MADDTAVRLAGVAERLAALGGRDDLAGEYGVASHHFRLQRPAAESAVAEFETSHGVRLPEHYRRFVIEVGDGGAGPGTGLLPLADVCTVEGRPGCWPGHLTRACPYLPGPRYPGWSEELYEDPPGSDQVWLPGTLLVCGGQLQTRLIVTGPACGRLFNVDADHEIVPYVVEDPDFLCWYERWLDEVDEGIHGYWFGEKPPGGEAELVAILDRDPAAHRRARAAHWLWELPSLGFAGRDALRHAAASDPDANVRATIVAAAQGRVNRHGLRTASPDDVARYARSNEGIAVEALAELDRLTLDDLEPDLHGTDVERRRTAATLLAFHLRGAPADRCQAAITRLLDDPDKVVRSRAVLAVRTFGLTHLHPILEAMLTTEPEPWNRHHLRWTLTGPTFGI
ncbi:HEAT repeat domain-containing protein [Dactylosporangium sp. CA-233914]|uniref:HEAT repeat domain-containing protein n=1 Tax=Dactylosporangium sp. CA-233914 TaxID=3239934 RepID=UPI003D9261EF